MLNQGAELLKARPGSQGAKASRLEVSQAFVSQICAGKKVPGDDLRKEISALYGIAPELWDAPPTGLVATAPPRTEPCNPDDAAVDLPKPGEGTSVLVRARELLAYLAVPRANQLELAQAREIRAALTLEARLVGAMGTKAHLHEHPDFGTWVEQLVHALASVPGALDVLEQALASTEERKVAA